MKNITVPSRDQVSPESQEIFDTMSKRLGRMPNLYATIGYSAASLKAMLASEESVSHGVFTAKEREAIYLVVSEVNHCDYCLAAHTLLARKRGFTDEEIVGLRKGHATDPRLHSAVQLAKAIAENKGQASEAVKDAFFAAGYDEAALMDLISLVTVRTFTNYVYALTKIPVDYPAVAPIQAEK